MKTDSSILPIENGEQYGRVFTRAFAPGTGGNVVEPGEVLIAVTKVETIVSNERHYDGRVTPAVTQEVLTFIIGARADTTIAALKDAADRANFYRHEASNEAQAAKKEAEAAVKDRDLLKQTAQEMLAKKDTTIKQRDEDILALRKQLERFTVLENDLAKVKRHIGEKVYAEALKDKP